MKYRDFGSTGLKISALGMGCMRLPGIKFIPMSVNYPKAIKLIRDAIDMGINYIDTAWVYNFGGSEKVLGLALKDGYREKVHLVTKLPMFLVKKAEDFDRILQEQLDRLQTNYLDAYLFHGLSEESFNKVIELNLISKMEEAREKGLIKYIGFSFHDILPAFKKIIDFYNWDIVLIQYNYLDTLIQATTEGLEYAYKKNIAIAIMEPLKGGLLVKPPKKALEILKTSKIKRTPVEWALQFLWNKKEVSVVLSGMGSEEMLKENCTYAENSGIGTLSNEDNAILEKIVNIYKEQILVPCTACNYCMPCPAGVNIPENFAIINYINSESYNFIDSIYKILVKRKYKKLTGIKEKINKEKPNGNASICIGCNKCIQKCPQSISIPAELEKVHKVIKKKKRIKEIFI